MMQYIRPFSHVSPTLSIAVPATAVSLVPTRANFGTQTLRIANVGDDVIFVELGEGTTAPAVTATTGVPILPNTTMFLLLRREVNFISAIGLAGGSTMYVTTGESAA